MKLLFLISSLEGGGAERIVQLLSKSFACSGHRITIASLDSGKPAYRFPPGVQIVRFKTAVLSKGILKIFLLPLQALELFFLTRRIKPDAAVSFLVRANLVNVLAGAFLGKRPVILSHRNYTQGLYGGSGLKDRIMRTLIAKLYIKADRIIAISKDVKTSLERLGVNGAKITVIPNFIDLPMIEEKAARKGSFPLLQDKPVIVSMGRLIEQKDFPALLRAFEIIKRSVDARLIIIGQGPLRTRLAKLAEELGVLEDVVFTGWLADPFYVLCRADVFALCSRYEGFGNVIIEAMACGLPVVCTNCPGGPGEILDNGRFGRLVSVGAADEMAHAILELLGDSELKSEMSRRSIQRAGQYRVENLAPEYLEVVQELKGS